jgi:hypothetical protein
LPPVVAQACASGKITNAFAATQPHLFYLISPEAARMTVLGTNQKNTLYSSIALNLYY